MRGPPPALVVLELPTIGMLFWKLTGEWRSAGQPSSQPTAQPPNQPPNQPARASVIPGARVGRAETFASDRRALCRYIHCEGHPPGQGGPSDVGAAPEAGRAGHVAPVHARPDPVHAAPVPVDGTLASDLPDRSWSADGADRARNRANIGADSVRPWAPLPLQTTVSQTCDSGSSPRGAEPFSRPSSLPDCRCGS